MKQTREDVFKEKAFIVDFQIALNKSMKERKIDRITLAGELGCSKYEIDSLFSDEFDVSARFVFKVMSYFDFDIESISCR